MNMLDEMLARVKPKPKVHQLAIVPILPFQWKQGEHLSLTGDTGSGKTTLANVLLHARGYTLSLRSKADDAPLPGARIHSASEFGIHPDINRYLLDPPYEKQFLEFWNALEVVWKQGHWTVYFDELFYLSQLKRQELRFESRVDRFLTQGRSKKITCICGMQRPVQVSRFALSQCTHMVSFSGEGRDIQILKDVAGKEFAEVVESLKRYEFAWFYRPERKVWKGRVQDLIPKVEAK